VCDEKYGKEGRKAGGRKQKKDANGQDINYAEI